MARLSPEERRAQLVRIGLEMVGARSFDTVSVDDIAAAAGISRGLLFHYFASKRDFFVAIAEAAADELLAVTAPDPADPPEVQLRGGVAAFVDFIDERGAAYRSLVRGPAGGDEAMQRVFERTRAAVADRVIDALAQLGRPVDAELRLALRGWVGFVEESVVTWLVDREVDREAVIELAVRALWSVLAAVGEQRDEQPTA